MTSAPVLAEVERALHDHFGQRAPRASISFLGVEPIEVLRFEPVPGERAYLTLGMSRRPMTPPSEFVVSETGPRAELMLHLRDPRDDYGEVWRQVAVLAASPAVEGVVFTAGMSIDLGQPLAEGSRCTGGIVVESPITPIETSVGGVEILQVVPATSTELAWSRVHGTPALRQRWADEHVDLLDLGRRAVSLD